MVALKAFTGQAIMSPSSPPPLTPPTATSQLSLNDWASRCVNLPGIQVQCWLNERRNRLDILCEGETCPDVSTIVDQLTLGLKQTNLQNLLPPDSSPVSLVCVHGRIFGQKRPNWTVRLHPQHPEMAAPPSPETQPTTEVTQPEATESSTRKISAMPPSQNWQAARQGNPQAIANYLSHTLKSWGLGVKVIVKIQILEKPHPETADDAGERTPERHPFNPWLANHLDPKGILVSSDSVLSRHPSSEPQKRLWVVCQSAYSPEPSSIAHPLSTRLRDLDLVGFKDAVILGQVSGEKQPEWILRVDLTPAKQMLTGWARWGDVQAITKLLYQRLREALPGSFGDDLQVSGVLKDSTLHIFLSDPGLAIDSAAYGTDGNTLNKEAVKAAIAPVLEAIAPQNIYGVTIYGLKGDTSSSSLDMDATPLWVDWLDLPASRFSHLAPTPVELARSGDLAALTFLLDRLLNPDLEEKLATGGIRISLRQKADLLHIMVDALTCPPRALGAKVAKFVATVNFPQVGGVRVYGRPAGQKQSQWRYGLDFQTRSCRSDFTPEFTVSEPTQAISSPDLLPQPGNLVIHPDLNSEDLQSCLTQPITTKLRKKKEESVHPLKQWLLLSGLVTPVTDHPNPNSTGVKVTIIWGLLGLLFTLQMDWLLAELLQIHQRQLRQASATFESSTMFSASPQGGNPQLTDFTGTNDSDLSAINWPKAEGDPEVFNSSGFTKFIPEDSPSFTAKPAQNFKYPSFNSQQMDEQLAIYAQYVANYGVPDVLIVGSSRALRGVDPELLRRQLADRHPNLRIFNFGINGATAQVVDFLVRELLGPKHLPRVIVWADGARAFNSGRSDRTFQIITASEGYKELRFGSPPAILTPESKPDNSLASLAATLADQAKKGISFSHAYQQLDKWLNEQVGSLSATYGQRDDLNQWFSDSLRTLISQRYKFPGLTASPRECQNARSNSDLACDPALDDTANSLDSITISDPKSASQLNGFLAIGVQFDPATYYDQFALVSGDYDADYESFNLNGQQTNATINLLNFLSQYQVSLVFVNMPLTEEYLDPIRMEHENTFQKYMLGLALKHGFIFRDFSQEWPKEHQFFSDPSHLNVLGAQRITERLSQDPLIPWPNSQANYQAN